MIFVNHKGEQLKGDAKKLTGYCEAIAYKLERENNHAEAHSYFQTAEYIKRELDGGKDSATGNPTRAGKKHYGNSRNHGRRAKPEYGSGEASPD